MSFFDAGKRHPDWGSFLALRASVRTEQGCVQCGSRLERAGVGKVNFSGKCLNCSEMIAEEDEVFEEF